MTRNDNKPFPSDPKNTNRPAGARHKKRRLVLSVVLTITLGGFALLLAAGASGYFMITHRPGDYQPRQWNRDPKLRKEEQGEVRQWGEKKVQELNNSMQLNAQEETSFIFRIEQTKWNDLLLTDETQKRIRWKWPGVSQQFRDIQFGFDNETIKIMGEMDYKGIQTVLTIVLSLKLTDTQRLQIALDSVNAGALPLPKSVIDTQLGRITKALRSGQNTKDGPSNLKDKTKDVEEFVGILDGWVQDLIEKRNMDVPVEFPVDVDKKARILALNMGQGYIDFTLKPFDVED